jgi:YgiT-type zinc finger domain-containing protein
MPHQCPFCGGSCSPQEVDHKVSLGSEQVVIEDLPVQVCTSCGEQDLSLDRLIELERDAARRLLPNYKGFDTATRVAVRKALPYEEWGEDLRVRRAARAFLEGDEEPEDDGDS